MQKLFKHQEEGVAFLKEKGRAILADEMGLGKTRQSIIAVGELTVHPVMDSENKFIPGACLIVCPASLKINWEREVQMVYPKDKIHVVNSGKEKEIPETNWIIINYDMLAKYFDQIMRLIVEKKITASIIDEAHYIKGKKTIRSKITLAITEKLEVVYALTGTPVMNRPAELFNLLRAIKHPLGDRATFYSKRYCDGHLETIYRVGRVIRFWDETGASHLPELHELTRESILRRLKKEVLDLPEKMISIRYYDFDREQKIIYDNAWDDYVDYVSNNPEGKDVENILNAQQLVELGKLKQVCSMSKIPRIVEDIENAIEQGEKVIVFTKYTKTLYTIAEECRKLKMETGKSFMGKKSLKNIKVATLSGSDKMEARQEAVDAFQNDPETKVFVANMIAGGVGLNLTAASIVMFADMDWSPEVHRQAEDRAHRIGQKGTVNVYYYVVRQTIEEDIVDLLEQKRAMIQEVVDGDASGRYAKEMERIMAMPEGPDREVQFESLREDMSKSRMVKGKSLAADFLELLKKRIAKK